jgi:hypothetical protein
MLGDKITNIPRKIFNFFTIEAERLGKESGFKKRCSKLTPAAFVKALLTSCVSEHFTLELFCSVLKEQKIIIRKQSLYERFNDYTVEFLRAMCSSCLKYFQLEKLPQLHGLESFTGLNIIDSSSVSLHSSLSNLFKGSGGAASSAALKIQLMFDYLEGQVKELTLTSGCDNDQGFTHYFNSIQEGALYLIDLGYFKLNSFKKIIEGHAFFVSRLLPGTKLFTLKKEPLDLLKTLSAGSIFFSQQVLMGAQHKIPVRLVAQRLTDECADRRRQKLKEGHRRRGIKPSQELLALQSWSIYITNTSETQINHQHIHQTYALRWQIELIFKLSKSLMHVDSINSTKSPRVIVETYGKFMTMMLLLLLCSPARCQETKELSFYKACKLFLIRLPDLLRAFNSSYRLKLFMEAFCKTLSLFAIKDIKKKHPLTLSLSAGEGF